MIRVFCDTEFTGFISAELISVGLLAEKSPEEPANVFYGENRGYNRKSSSKFVKAVVEPLLTPDVASMDTIVLAHRSRQFIEALDDSVWLMVDHSADIEMMDWLWQGNRPKNLEKIHLIHDDLKWYSDSRIDAPDIDFKGSYDMLYSNFFLVQEKEFGKNMQHHALNDCFGAQSAYNAIKQFVDENSRPNDSGLILPCSSLITPQKG